jgi:hypothetical protein
MNMTEINLLDKLKSFWDWLNWLIIDENYKLDDNLKWNEQIPNFIMHYRRIIGIIMLIILIGIMKYCDGIKKKPASYKIQKGGGSDYNFGQFTFGAGAAAAAAGSGSGPAAAAAAAGSGGSSSDVVNATKAINSAAKGATAVATNNSGKPKNLVEDIKGMKDAGMTKMDMAKNFGSRTGRFIGEKSAEFANWLYEILFALAISVAICMIIIPSVSFFFLGLICYFLLRKKIVSIKSL